MPAALTGHVIMQSEPTQLARLIGLGVVATVEAAASHITTERRQAWTSGSLTATWKLRGRRAPRRCGRRTLALQRRAPSPVGCICRALHAACCGIGCNACEPFRLPHGTKGSKMTARCSDCCVTSSVVA
jgi:hypothetical protein